MTYGLEVVIPTEVRMPISRTNDFEQKSNDLTITKKLDMVEENREVAMIKLVEFQQMISHGYNKNVKALESLSLETWYFGNLWGTPDI